MNTKTGGLIILNSTNNIGYRAGVTSAGTSAGVPGTSDGVTITPLSLPIPWSAPEIKPSSVSEEAKKTIYSLINILGIAEKQLSSILGREIRFSLLENVIKEDTAAEQTIIHLVVFDQKEDRLTALFKVKRYGKDFILYDTFFKEILEIITIGGLKKMTCEALNIDLSNEIDL